MPYLPPKLIITRGLPASGKTTRARKEVAAAPEVSRPMVRVNRDDLRSMLHVGEWNANKEMHTRLVRDATIRAALLNGIDVICDDTHLPDAEVIEMQSLAAENGAELVVIDLRNVGVAECIARDAVRDTSVGEAVIRRLAASGGLA